MAALRRLARRALQPLDRMASRRSAARLDFGTGAHPAAEAYREALRDLHRPVAEEDRAALAGIEALRRRLLRSDQAVAMVDFGAGSLHAGAGEPSQRTSETTVAEITRSTSKPARWARFLYHLVRQADVRQGLELGTSMGISAAYQAAALHRTGGRLVTIEGSPPSAALAERHLTVLGYTPDPVTIRVGRFSDVLDGVLAELEGLDYVFIDGHHDEDATKAYFAQIKPHLRSGATVVLDDIRWSEGMLAAWREVAADPDVAVALDCGAVGIVCVAPGAAGRAEAQARVG